jgi:putative copper resistance protein D
VMGSINTWYLVGSFAALTDTDYGRLLLIKVALFFGMVAIAAVNRLHFTPRLAQVAHAFGTQDALRQLHRSSLIELVIGTIIIGIVAVLGVTPYGSHHFR